MPENSECRIVAEELREHLRDKQILSYKLGDKAKTTGFDYLRCPAHVLTVRSHGKKVIIELDEVLLFASLGMTGRFQFLEGNHSNISFAISDDRKMYFDDTRHFGKIEVIKKEDEEKYLSKLGPDVLQHALTESISKKTWRKLFKPKLLRRKIGDILLDQSIVSGIGMYMMTDILYLSKVSPFRLGNTITMDELELMRVKSHEVALKSYQHGGLTIRDYISPNGRRGGYPTQIYGKTHDKNGYRVRDKKAGSGKSSRTFHYVKQVQI